MVFRKSSFFTYFLGVVLAAGIVGYQISAGYQQQTENARITVENLAWVLQQRLDATLRRTDATLENLVSNAPAVALHPAMRAGFEADINARLKAQRLKFPEIGGFRYIDAKGDLLYTSDLVNNFANLADRIYFKTLRDQPAVGLVYSDVVVSRFTGKSVIVLGRGIRSKTGEFLGAATAVLNMDSYSELFASLNLGEHGLIAIRNTDSRLVLRHPLDPALVNKPVVHPLQTLVANGQTQGVLRYQAATDGIDRLFAFRRVPDYPFYFIVGIAADDYLAGWRHQTLVTVALSLLVLVIFSWQLLRLARARLHEAEQARCLAAQEQSLRVALQAAQAASLAKSQFLATMSHELRTPMNAILGMAQLQAMPGTSDKDAQQYAQVILSSGQTLLTLLNDILDMSKVEAGQVKLESLVFDPAHVLREVTGLFEAQAHAKGLRIETVWRGASGAHFWGDPTRLRQMLGNLTSNAIKFTEQGFVRIEGCQQIAPDGTKMLEFSVTDSGIGIATELQDQLFKPFSQLDASNTRKYGGSGLGLSIARRFAELMGGAVGLESQAGKGSRFWIRLPLAQAQASALPADVPQSPSPAAPLAVPAPDGVAPQAGYVLIVDDNMVNRMVVEMMLDKLGIRFQSVENGQQAVDAVTQGATPPVLVLMDCQMPVLDGFAATEQIRQWEKQAGRTQRLPIVALTAGVFQEDRDRCLTEGMDEFMSKTVNLDDLQRVLAQWMQGPHQLKKT